ncbi:hypothetical protein [Hyphomonas sp.]|jgi:hypothetical protein|uniref:hypothetical protein n=1 Tax=Hyphomonas sp. TaxID=87 RepID=UPI0032D8D3DB
MKTNVAFAQDSAIKAKAIEITVLSASLGALFLIVNYLHFQYVPVAVILFACIWDAIIASILVLGAYWLFRRRTSPLLVTELALTAIASNLLILLYSVMGPTVIDRSLSIYIVEKLDQRGGEVAAAAIEDIIRDEYLDEFKVPEVRMTEQLTSGTVVSQDGCLHLTPKGRRLSGFAHFYRAHFLPRKRVIGGEVTDSLLDPLKGQPVRVPFACDGSDSN